MLRAIVILSLLAINQVTLHAQQTSTASSAVCPDFGVTASLADKLGKDGPIATFTLESAGGDPKDHGAQAARLQ